MKHLLLLLVVTSLCSCGVAKVFETLDQVTSTTQEVIKQVNVVVAKIEEVKAAAAEADTNKDGETSTAEWLAWLAAGGGGGGLIALVRTALRNVKSDGRKDLMEARIDAVERSKSA